VSQLSHMTFSNPTKSSLYLASFLETVIWEPTLYKLLTFHNQNLVCIFRCLGHLSKVSVQVQGSYIRNKFIFYGEELLTPWSLSFVHDCLLDIFSAMFLTWRPFLHLQPENLPLCGDRTHLTWKQESLRLENHNQFWYKDVKVYARIHYDNDDDDNAQYI
jgi:hypothetical protein